MIMHIMDLVLFFLDTFLWYVIWNSAFSIARSFKLGLSIWTPWSDNFTHLPKSIYAKLLATRDMEVKYKPKVSSVLRRLIYTDKGIKVLVSSNLEHNHHLPVS